MGSDLYMESQNWRPRPNKVTWVGENTISVERDAFYHGYQEVYRGPVNSEVELLLKGFGAKVPPKPKNELLWDMKYNIRVFGDAEQDLGYYERLGTSIDAALKRAVGQITEEFPELRVEVR